MFFIFLLFDVRSCRFGNPFRFASRGSVGVGEGAGGGVGVAVGWGRIQAPPAGVTQRRNHPGGSTAGAARYQTDGSQRH